MLVKEKCKCFFGDYWKYVDGIFHLLDPIYSELKEKARKNVKIFPQSKDTFRAFKETPLTELKIIVLSLDPYPWMKDNKVVADGLSFSCKYTPIQPSLEKFFDGIRTEYGEFEEIKDLGYLAEQGVMLLNSSLTVEKGKVGSNLELWQPFMKKFLEEISYSNTGLIFWLMGDVAKKYQSSINNLGNYIIFSEHPAAAEHQSRDWDYKNAFSQIDKILKSNNNESIDWTKPKLPF